MGINKLHCYTFLLSSEHCTTQDNHYNTDHYDSRHKECADRSTNDNDDHRPRDSKRLCRYVYTRLKLIMQSQIKIHTERGPGISLGGAWVCMRLYIQDIIRPHKLDC